MTESSLSTTGNFLQKAIHNISTFDNQKEGTAKGQTLHVPNVANALLFAYEQLRNASENIEDHLLLQRAILRFYKRNLTFSSSSKPKNIAKELIIELTQAEYIKNNTISLSTVTAIQNLINEYVSYYPIMAKATNDDTARKWIFELLSVKTENAINNPIRVVSFAHFAHAHFSEIIDYSKLVDEAENIASEDYPTLLYIAIHKALLKSDDANVRANLLELYPKSIKSPKALIDFNNKYDAISSLTTTAKVTKFVDRNGAALRIARSAFFEDDVKFTDITKRNRVRNLLETTIDSSYKRVRSSVNIGVIKSIIFLLITKAIVGLLIEIPYDIITTGTIIMMPLFINLFFPPAFIAISALTFRMPGSENKDAILQYIESMVYADQRPQLGEPRYTEKVGSSILFNSVYVITFVVAFYIIGSRLIAWNFSIVQAFIFLLFFSTASFLGYRLTLQIKELEFIATSQGFISIVRDFLYSPFIFIGKRISYRFSQLNLIAQILDIVIDLPLKTTVRLVRQWTIFLNNKKDELL